MSQEMTPEKSNPKSKRGENLLFYYVFLWHTLFSPSLTLVSIHEESFFSSLLVTAILLELFPFLDTGSWKKQWAVVTSLPLVWKGRHKKDMVGMTGKRRSLNTQFKGRLFIHFPPMQYAAVLEGLLLPPA